MVPMVVPVIKKKQWPSHISGGSCTLLVLKSSNSRIISTWWHNNTEFAQKDAQSIHWECLSIHPGYSSSPKAYVTLIWRTRYRSDIDYISSRGKNLILNQSSRGQIIVFPHFPLKGYELKEIPRIWLPYDRKFSFKWSRSQLEFVNETLTFRAMAWC